MRPVPPTYIGRSCIVVVAASKAMTPTYFPDPPTPQMARPAIKAFIDGAALQTAEPTLKRVTQRIYVHLALNCMCAETKSGYISRVQRLPIKRHLE